MGGATDNVVQPTYGRGQRSRNSSSIMNYRKLAGEVPNYEYSTDEIRETFKRGFDSYQYANKHVFPFLNRTFDDSSSVLQIVSNGKDLTVENLVSLDHPLCHNRPILVTDTATSIGMRMLPQKKGRSKVTISDFGALIGMNHPVTVMDVRTQEELEGWNFGDLVDYFMDEDRMYTSIRNEPRRVLNQISLEFSQTPLRNKISSPKFVRELDWIDTVWPHSRRMNGDFPRVQYYCLTSTAGCYTDFHLDFGGTSVFYHMHSGRKTFLMIPPTETNLALYEKWLCSKNQSDTFFPDMEQEIVDSAGNKTKQKVGPVIRITLEEEQTFIIPSAWIHAVYTPKDSIVIGGNFLHGLDMKLQLDIHCLETRTRVPAKFRFPSFVQLMFYAGVRYYKKLLDPKNDGLFKQEMDGLGSLIQALKAWSVQSGGDAVNLVGSVPNTMLECIKMVRDIGIDVKDCNELWLSLEREYEQVKGRINRQYSGENLKLTISLKQTHSLDKQFLLQKNKGNQVIKKPKLKLKLGPMSPIRRNIKLDNKAPVVLSAMNLASMRTKRYKRQKISDLSSKHSTMHDQDDGEWKPGIKRRRLKSQPIASKKKFTSNIPSQTNIFLEEEKEVSNIPISITPLNSPNQKKCKRELQIMKKRSFVKRKGGGVKARLQRKFGRR